MFLKRKRSLRHRKVGYSLLKGRGLEIGALHEKASLPSHCQVDYCDAITKEEAMKLFPEIKHHKLVDVKYICNLDDQGLNIFPDNTYDFVLLSHVIEHVANPINVVKELFRVVKPGGLVLITVPDKNYTFDKNRDITPFQHLLDEYRSGVKEITDDHYIDFIKGVLPELLLLDKDKFKEEVLRIRNRREHAHVWTSASFKEFLNETFRELNIRPSLVLENTADTNLFEYYSLWQKNDANHTFPVPKLNAFNKFRLAARI